MSESSKTFSTRRTESILGAISAGAFFILIGIIFAVTPNLFDKILSFLGNFDTIQIPHTNIYLPAPISPVDHVLVYSAVGQFAYVWGLFQIVMLALRIFAHSPLSKKAETGSNIVFWLGASFLIQQFLNETIILSETTSHETWFAFWATIIMLAGVTLIIRGIIQAFRR